MLRAARCHHLLSPRSLWLEQISFAKSLQFLYWMLLHLVYFQGGKFKKMKYYEFFTWTVWNFFIKFTFRVLRVELQWKKEHLKVAVELHLGMKVCIDTIVLKDLQLFSHLSWNLLTHIFCAAPGFVGPVHFWNSSSWKEVEFFVIWCSIFVHLALT